MSEVGGGFDGGREETWLRRGGRPGGAVRGAGPASVSVHDDGDVQFV
jgi:hypothetical protein